MEIDERHKQEYLKTFNELQSMKNNTDLSDKEFDNARCFRIDVIANLLNECERDKND